jgi:hypothetical protein
LKSLEDIEIPENSDKSKNLYAGIKLMALLSESIREDSSTDLWIDPITFKRNIIDDEKNFKIFLGLLYQKSEGIVFHINGSDKPLREILDEKHDDIKNFNALLDYVKLLDGKWANIKSSKSDIDQKKIAGTELTYVDYYEFFSVNLDLIEAALDLDLVMKTLDYPLNLNAVEEAKTYLAVLRKGNQIYKNVNEKDFSAVVTNFLSVYQSIVAEHIENFDSDDISQVTEFLNRAGISTNGLAMDVIWKKFWEFELKRINVSPMPTTDDGIKKEYNRKLKSGGLEWGIPKGDILRYASFMASMIEANSPEEVKNLISNAALPAGSSSIKKNSSFNISVQSYLGLYRNLNHDATIDRAWNNRFGVIAPVGVSFNLGLKKWGSIGLMASILDVGAVVDYEIRRDTVAATSMTMDGTTVSTTTTETITEETDFKIELGQILSPGIYVVYGFGGNIPLTLGAGWQSGPGLAEFNGEDSILRERSSRFNIFLGFDIPLFTVHNGKKRSYARNNKK